MRSSRLLPSIGLPVAALLVLGACGSGSDAPPVDGTGSQQDTVAIVASTNVYGDIAQTVGGDAVTVTSIIADPSADPHSYQANAQTQLALSKADIVIENGGGYDDFVDTMLDAAENDSVTVLNAVDISGKVASGDAELNEHVWYDFPSVGALTDELVAALSKAAPGQAGTFAANAAAFKTELAALEKTEQDLAAQYTGEGVAITEPVPLYLLEAAGLVNLTPAEFAEAIEEETDVPPSALQATIELFADDQVAALVYNEQVTGPQTEQVLKAASDNDVPVVPITETLPEGSTYISWMTGNLNALRDALAK